MSKKLVLVDSNALMHRAYHALPPLTNSKGEKVNAVYGFFLAFFKAIKELKPDYICACFDLPGPTFRHEKFAEYKATRPETPDDLVSQIPKLKKLLSVFKVRIAEKKGFEADDLIGTIAKKFSSPEIKTVVLTGDMDILQLINDNTKVLNLRRGVKDAVLYDKEKVKKRYHILPSQVPDFKALKGDASDNIPGVPGIGEKTAAKILKRFSDIEDLFKQLEKNTELSKEIKPKTRKSLAKFKKQVFLSKDLAEINNEVSINLDIEQCKWGQYEKEEVVEALKELEFKTLIKKLLLEKESSQPERKTGSLF